MIFGFATFFIKSFNLKNSRLKFRPITCRFYVALPENLIDELICAQMNGLLYLIMADRRILCLKIQRLNRALSHCSNGNSSLLSSLYISQLL